MIDTTSSSQNIREIKEYVIVISTQTNGVEIMQTNKGVYERPIGSNAPYKKKLTLF